MTKRQVSFLFFFPALLLFPGCDGGGEEMDAGMEDSGLEMSELFGPCVADSQCPGEGAICRSAADGYPGGYCTVPCEDRTPCDARGVYNHCFTRVGETQAYCEQRCLNGLDCGREAYTCINQDEPTQAFCIAICSTDEQCGEGFACNAYTGECAATVPSTGGVTGDPCADNDACRSGRCLTMEEFDWPGGSCIGTCILPSGYNSNDFYAGTELPNAGCPGEALCLPFADSQSRQDLGFCLAACASDTDCRDGYFCRMEFASGAGVPRSFTNGVCFPNP